MSARITLHCNRMWPEGSCPTQVMTDARTVEEARAAARQLGWRPGTGETDFCPTHSGASIGCWSTPVIHLHPPTPEEAGC
ncbi:hypothetical protein ACGFWI_01080 [Streptomyces sp. NPDC048434]|uniref:hypothetical protein n=1 Tax=Streptomyces sp. NPDC048434 TaxID=3365549 RepID=UPI003710D03F